MRFPTMWYVCTEKPQISLRMRAVCSLPLLSLEYSMSVKLLTEHHLEFLSLKGGCTCQNATLLDITCHGSYMFSFHMTRIFLTTKFLLIF